MIDEKYLNGKAQRADQHQKVSVGDGQSVIDAEQIHTEGGQRHTKPHAEGNLLFQKESGQGNDHDVQSGDKAGFAHGGIGVSHTDLLKRAGNHQSRTAQNTAQPKRTAGGRCIFRSGGSAASESDHG